MRETTYQLVQDFFHQQYQQWDDVQIEWFLEAQNG